ncbi:uncharacterized protein LOC126109543 [Schistocerca cancellata]|uniref:uncharacterized protein LOC126109543 n=1 Tax=Schistocerca cancellata TaxID=274614 RepID=UPI00211817E4|nr:uncharacterized protein LOC126109543 [Schistocerca cancellata]
MIDDFNQRVIRDTIAEFDSVQKIVPSLRTLLPVLHDKIGWKWSIVSLRKVLLSMGVIWRKVENKRNRKGDLREESVVGVTAWGSSPRRLVVASVGSKNEFIKEGQLMFWAKSTKGDYHGQMNSANFEKWFGEKVLPNLPPNSVIVMDNALYHNRQTERTPTKFDTKVQMLDWLQRRNIPCDESIRKDELNAKVRPNKPAEKSFAVNQLDESKGHQVVRSPSYNCDLNAIELAWAKIKRRVREHNISADLAATNMLKLVDAAFQSVTANDWKGYCKKVKETEEYWARNGVVEIAVDEIIINTATSDASEEDSDTQTEDSDSESESD